jgi:hypothetical protein
MRAVFSLSELIEILFLPAARTHAGVALSKAGVGSSSRNITTHEGAGYGQDHNQNESSHCSFSLNLDVRTNIIVFACTK